MQNGSRRVHPRSNLQLRVCLAAVAALTSPAALGVPAEQAYVKASNTGTGDLFGYAVAVSGNIMVVGAPNEYSSALGANGDQADNTAVAAGAAYIFVRNGSSWVQEAYLKASNTRAYDAFGTSVAVSDNTVVIGARSEFYNGFINSGAAYVFVRNGTNWSQQAYLKASNAGADAFFAWSVGISADTVVVGAPGEASDSVGVNGEENNNSAWGAGAAYVFVRSGTNWTQQAYLKASNAGAGDLFGFSVALADDTIVVGACLEESSATEVNRNQNKEEAENSGAAYVFVRRGRSWSEQAYLKASNAGSNHQFGASVAVSDDTIAVGACGECSNSGAVSGNPNDESSSLAGAAYVFVRNGINWKQQACLQPSIAEGSFGISVSISGDTVAVAATGEDSKAKTVNGDDGGNSAIDSGAAYVFVRRGTRWSQQAFAKASNAEAYDYFGHSVSVSGNTMVVGAFGESSNASGVNGDPSDNTAYQAGAAYVFTGVGVIPHGRAEFR